ncbi:extracellular solute-binding protein [Gilvimarinus xylanilyticus]|uniref:Extracellular solute-binding protein n=1 Tax=Gilvimarinus xylanilyticus TaxID=2944139 RepID=A0A9X2HXU4_9GAMM|nr:extracellular solute-binding protein [Gilvimarinus xylanilyticus]MCP8898531.1 extracellular solute-binding protein [Gilvimarinus xylanilyticus]
MRSLIVPLFMLGAASFVAPASAQTEPSEVVTHTVHAVSSHLTPQYSEDFTHFDYVNPDAPKGGTLRMAALGTYDSFNRFARRGDPVAEGLKPYQRFIYDTLMIDNDDEYGVLYPLIAESVTYPEDYTWVEYNINPKAQFNDGEPVTAEDVAFSFNKFVDQGLPQIAVLYKHVKDAKVVDEHTVRFEFDSPQKNYITDLAGLTILPQHYWQDKDLSAPLSTPPVGSGPYVVSDFDMGSSVTYSRVKDYWAKDLPSRKGLFNFDTIIFEYFLDRSVTLEAFKAGEYDFRAEAVMANWKEAYDIPAVNRGDIVKAEIPNKAPKPLTALIFNTQRAPFTNRKVRQALNYMLDFESLNKTLFYGEYTRAESYFQDTKYKAEGKPEGKELEILNQYKDQLPPEVFGEVWRPNQTDGSGRIRGAMREALALLKEAGWTLKDRRLVNQKTGEPMEFELLIYDNSTERYANSFKKNLDRIGITMNIRKVDTSQYMSRVHEKDFQMVSLYFTEMPYPSTDMELTWHSKNVNSSWNTAGVNDPVIDSMVENIAANQGDDELLTAYGRAFDRVALWNFYGIPRWYSADYRVAYWNKFSRPASSPKLEIGLDTWWYDEQKAKTLKP